MVRRADMYDVDRLVTDEFGGILVRALRAEALRRSVGAIRRRGEHPRHRSTTGAHRVRMHGADEACSRDGST